MDCSRPAWKMWICQESPWGPAPWGQSRRSWWRRSWIVWLSRYFSKHVQPRCLWFNFWRFGISILISEDSSDVVIPSTYIKYTDYIQLEALIAASNTTHSGLPTLSLLITAEYSAWEWYSWALCLFLPVGIFNFFQSYHRICCHPSSSFRPNIHHTSHSPNTCSSGSPTRSCPGRYRPQLAMAGMDWNALGETRRRGGYERSSRNPLRRGGPWRSSPNTEIVCHSGRCVHIPSKQSTLVWITIGMCHLSFWIR